MNCYQDSSFKLRVLINTVEKLFSIGVTLPIGKGYLLLYYLVNSFQFSGIALIIYRVKK